MAEDAEAGLTQDFDPIPQAPAAQDDFPRDDLAPLDDDKTHDDAHPVFSDYASI
ncbi:MAG: hypothetical protein ACO3U1_07725 [Marivivens sp.]